MKIINIVGARPNFMKIAPLIREMGRYNKIEQLLVHTGQHYDYNMSDLFFKQLDIPRPDIFLEVGSGSHAEQTAKIMVAFEKVLIKEKPDLTLVVGDVNSTIACALVSVKMGIPVVHVEAGLRSFDRSMPEEINRILTDAISQYLFITEKEARKNLLREGVKRSNIYFVGNVMIDTLFYNLKKAHTSKILSQLDLKPKGYALLTLHRASNVDDKDVLNELLSAVDEMKETIKIVFPLHPRTRQKITEFGLAKKYPYLSPRPNIQNSSVIVTEPLGYLDFLKLMSQARLVLTDSGGMQEETTVLGIPCLTLRENTERPITITQGTNHLVGMNKKNIMKVFSTVLNENREVRNRIPEYWDGKASQRIVKTLMEKHG